MEKNLITEIRRISELIGVNNNTILNEGILGNLFKNVVESELIAILKAEIKAAMKQGIEVVSQKGTVSTTVKDAAEAAVKTKSGLNVLTNTQKKGIEAELTRLAKEEAETIVRKKGSTATLTAAEKEAYEKLAAAEKSRLGAKSLGQGTREKLIRKVTSDGKNVTFKSTKVPRGITNNIKQATREAAIISATQKWNWPRWLKWGAGLSLSGLAVYWLITNWDGPVHIGPKDMPKTDEGLTDDGNGQGRGTGGGGPTGKFKDCTGTYIQGCKSEVIRKVQGCLDIKPDGLFGPKTQAALESKEFKNGFTDADVDKLCPANVVVEPPISKEDQYGYDTGNQQGQKPPFDSTVSHISVDKLDTLD